MKIKDVILKKMGDTKYLTLKRFKSSKLLFVMMGILFFTNYFLASNFIDQSIYIKLLPYSYIAFVFSSVLLSYFSLKNKFIGKISPILFFIILIILIVIGITFTLPFLIDTSLIPNII